MADATKRELLLEEAARVLNRQGLANVSLADIAKDAGITRSALYYYVDDMQDLVYRCYRQTCAQLAGLIIEASEQYDNELDILCGFIALALSDGRSELASISELAFLKDEQRKGIVGLYRGLRSTLADIIRSGVEKGTLRPVSSPVTASILLSLIFWVPVVMRWPIAQDKSKAEFSNTIQQIMRVGISRKRLGPSEYQLFNFNDFREVTGNPFEAEVRKAARRSTLLAAASWLFKQKGVAATSLDEIASRVGMSKKVIYHYVGNKERLVAECFQRSFELLEFASMQVKQFEGPRLDAICTSLASLADANARPDLTLLVPMTGHGAWPEDVRKVLNDSQERLLERTIAGYKAGYKEGSLRRLQEDYVVMIVPGIYEWTSHMLETLPDPDRQRAPIDTANFLRLGLAPL